MGLLSSKRALSLLAAGAGAVALSAAAGTGTASAACTSITGQGSSLQNLAQGTVWAPRFIAGTCTGITIRYTGNSSGAGLAAWSASGTAAPSHDAFVGTDDAPNTAQIASIRSNAGGSTGLEVIPTAQAAISIMVNLPAGCAASTGVTSLTANEAALAAAYSGTKPTFSALFPGQLTGTCGTVGTVFARSSSSGTTLNVKNYLSRLAGWTGPVTPLPSDWAGTVSTTASSGIVLANAVDTTASSIGYANLADAALPVANGGPAMGGSVVASGQGFFVRLPNASTGALPQSGSVSNCAGTTYAPSAGGALPTTTENADWSTVFGANTRATNYPLCALTYDLAYNVAYTGLNTRADGTRFNANEGDTVQRYLNYITGTLTGQVAINSNNYAPLPAAIRTLAAAGVTRVN
jgi:ABC-type phosphate transport system substrate-binding protein